MVVNHVRRKGRSAQIIAEYEHTVLYNAIENGKVFYANMLRSSDSFWREYAA